MHFDLIVVSVVFLSTENNRELFAAHILTAFFRLILFKRFKTDRFDKFKPVFIDYTLRFGK